MPKSYRSPQDDYRTAAAREGKFRLDGAEFAGAMRTKAAPAH
jgi:hypothetical protein